MGDTHKCIKTSLKSILKQDKLQIIQDTVKDMNRLVTYAYQFIRLFILHKAQNKQQIPIVNKQFVFAVLRILGKKGSKGAKPKNAVLNQELIDFKDKHFLSTFQSYNSPSYYKKTQILIAHMNDIAQFITGQKYRDIMDCVKEINAKASVSSLFHDIFEESDEPIVEIYNSLAGASDPFERLGILGYGDEGEVWSVTDKVGTYALKLYRRTYRRDTILSHNAISWKLNIAPKIWYIGQHGGILFVLTDQYDVTLRDYLKEHPSKREYYEGKLYQILKNMLGLGYFDYDFKMDNIMLNRNDPDRLYFIDTSLSDSREDTEYVNEVLAIYA